MKSHETKDRYFENLLLHCVPLGRTSDSGDDGDGDAVDDDNGSGNDDDSGSGDNDGNGE